MLPKLCLLAAACLAQGPADRPLAVDSPNGRIRAEFRLDETGAPTIQVSYGGEVVARGELGLALAEGGPIREGLELVGTTTAERDETYKIPVGKTSTARDHHRELAVSLREKKEGGRGLGVVLRAFDDGLAFRYVLPGAGEFVLTDELTRLAFPGDPTARLLPLAGYTTSYENYYQSKKVSEIGPKDLAGVPMLLSRPDGGPWIAVTEAALTDYAGMYLAGAEGRPGTLESRLSPLPGRADGEKVIGRAPFETPWRVLMVADAPGRLIESDLVFHLNPPSKIADPSWIRPGKTTFPWWNGYAMTKPVGFEPGVNTATMDHYIDFAAEAGIEYHSLDGLDIAWYGGPIGPIGPVDLTKAAPSLDLPEILARAKEKSIRIRLWMHWRALRPQIDEAFAAYEKWGVEGVMVDFMDRDDQEMVAFYHEMAEKAARHHLTLTLHGAYKPTGMERTWPNVLNFEAALNQEYNKWGPPGGGTPPAHNLDIAFVRMLAGPVDYHQGGMRNVSPADYKPSDKAPPVQGTRGHQIGMYVVYQNHLPMMADDPGAYRGQPELPFVVSIPSTWDETRVPLAEPGRLIVLARRSGADWYMGGMAAGAGREVEIPLDFLPEGDYKAELYVDDPAAGPTSVQRLDLPVERAGLLRLSVAADGGFVGKLIPSGKP